MDSKMMIKKLGLAISLIGATYTAYAAEKTANKKECNDSTNSECTSLCFAGPVLDCDNDLEVMAAALYAQVRADASQVALFNGSNASIPSYPEQATGIEPTEKASWGFKVGLGWKTGHDDWKVAARYTWFRAISDGTYEQSYGGAYIPTAYSNDYVAALDNPDAAVSYANLEAGNYTWISDLNVYLTRPTLYTSYLEISPYFGIDFNLLRRRQTITFSNDLGTNLNDGGYIRTYDRNFWWGVGPMAGVASSWLVGYNVSVVAESYLALTYGLSESYSDTTSFDPDGGDYNYSAVISNDFYQFSPDLYFQLGLEWAKNFDDDTKAFAFRIAYENDYYFQVNKTIVNNIRYRKSEMGALGYQGLVLQAQFDF
jgi:hypothetical protein